MRVNIKIKKIANKSLSIVLSLALFVLPFVPGIASADNLTDLENKKDYLAQQRENAEKLAEQKAQDADFYESQVYEAKKQLQETESALSQTEGRITSTEKAIKDLQSKIKTEEDNLAREKNKLNKIVASWYMEGEEGFLEAVIGSNDLSEVVTKQEYYNSIQQQIETSIEKVEKLKKELNSKKDQQEKEKRELELTKSEQVSYKQTIEYQKSKQNNLMNSALSEKEDYLNEAARISQEIAVVSAAIYAERQRRISSNHETISSGGSAYPFSAIDVPDPWGFLTRECTSYAAWYWNVRLGRSWYRGPGPVGTGDAGNWPNLVSRNNVSNHSSAKVGAIISWQRSSIMPYGHVAIVERVNSNGTIDVSEFNWLRYSYSYRSGVNPANYGGYSYIY